MYIHISLSPDSVLCFGVQPLISDDVYTYILFLEIIDITFLIILLYNLLCNGKQVCSVWLHVWIQIKR